MDFDTFLFITDTSNIDSHFSEASEYEIKEALRQEWGRNCDGTLHFKKAHCFCFTVAIRIVIRDHCAFKYFRTLDNCAK